MCIGRPGIVAARTLMEAIVYDTFRDIAWTTDEDGPSGLSVEFNGDVLAKGRRPNANVHDNVEGAPTHAGHMLRLAGGHVGEVQLSQRGPCG